MRGLGLWLALVACGPAAVAPKPPPIVVAKPADIPTEAELLADVRWLADPARAGREAGTPGERAADAWVKARFESLTLEIVDQEVPLGSSTTHNVIGILRGSDTNAPWILLGAHVDHLGPGFPGADDNASGVAGMLGVAAAIAAEPRRAKTIAFVAFGGEEKGLVGSRFFVANPHAPIGAMINLDMIGRSPFLGASDFALGKTFVGIEAGPAVGVLDNAGDAPMLAHARAACDEAGIKLYAPEDFPLFESQIRDEARGRSDDSPFAAAGIPTLFFSTSLQDDYHRRTDTPDKIDGAVLHAITKAVWKTIARL